MTLNFQLCRITLVLFCVLTGCQNSGEPPTTQSSNDTNTATISTASQPLPVPSPCQKPSPVKDIWNLEPMLMKTGEINDSMSKEEKERVIKSYIARKNAQYQICIKGVK